MTCQPNKFSQLRGRQCEAQAGESFDGVLRSLARNPSRSRTLSPLRVILVIPDQDFCIFSSFESISNAAVQARCQLGRQSLTIISPVRR